MIELTLSGFIYEGWEVERGVKNKLILSCRQISADDFFHLITSHYNIDK